MPNACSRPSAEALAAQLPEPARERGYFTVKRRDGREYVRPIPKLAIGILPVLPGVFESRHEVIAVAKRAAGRAQAQAAGAIYVDEDLGNAYPQSVLFEDDAPPLDPALLYLRASLRKSP